MSDGGAIEAKVMRTLLPRLRANSKAHILIRLSADRIEQLEQRIAKAESALELIATPKRPDGTWNRDREACRLLAAEALEDLK